MNSQNAKNKLMLISGQITSVMESKKKLLFRLEGPDRDKRIMINADSAQSVNSSAVRKFGLADEHYRVSFLA